MTTVPKRAMVLAAGRGERLRPLTDRVPKPLVEVGGKPLIDHALDRLASVGVEVAVVNVSYRRADLENHLKGRRHPKIIVSPESGRLETGGGVVNALDSLGDEPFYVINSDVLWTGGRSESLIRLAEFWDLARMDALLLVQPTVRAVGYNGRGDFQLGPLGEVRRREERETAPFVFAGVQILAPRLFADCPATPFSLNLIYDRAMRAGRLFGFVNEGRWTHVGTSEGLARARASYPTPSHAPPD